MKSLVLDTMVPFLAAAIVACVAAPSQSAEKAEPRLAHMVFFTLKDHSAKARRGVRRVLREIPGRARGDRLLLGRDDHRGRLRRGS